MSDPTKRFSTRVANYIKYRPGYPLEIVDMLEAECGLTPSSIIADVGSGTGILAEMFLKNGNTVFGVEPNREMREAGERFLERYERRFKSVAASAEETTLDSESVDFITAGQAFHWFDRERVRKEFARILKPQGWTVIIWNERSVTATPFLVAYERLLQTYGTDYKDVGSHFDAEIVRTFFMPDDLTLRAFKNSQTFDYESLLGRLHSASYTPEPGHANYQPMLDELRALFDAHQQDGRISFDYDTLVYYGHLTARS
jgi:SAM-dependent methyltransferase